MKLSAVGRQVQPVIESAFNNRNFVWGKQPVVGNNAKFAGNTSGICTTGRDRSRENRSFLALAAGMTIEDMLVSEGSSYEDIRDYWITNNVLRRYT